MTITLRDVTLRDGLQDEEPISTDAKLAILDALVAAGIDDVELTSFVRADRVPAMSDAEEMVRATAGRADELTRWGLVLNLKGAQRALAAGLRHLQAVISVSDAHHRHNAGHGVDEAVLRLADIVDAARADGAVVELTLATAFGCPFTGPVSPDDVIRVAEAAASAGVAALSLADTIGTAVPGEVAPLVRAVGALGLPVGVHLHDTRGLAITNALEAIDAGAVRVDGAVGGLGGCPFAPGASGNLPLEDLAHVLDAMGVDTGLDLDRLVAAAELACSSVGRPVASHVGIAGPRFRNTPYAQG